MTTQEASRLNSGFTHRLNDAIRENPVSAGLVGLGLVWMVLEGSKASTIPSKLPGAARAVTEAVGSATHATGSAVGGALRGTGALVKDTTGRLARRFHLLQKVQLTSCAIRYPLLSTRLHLPVTSRPNHQRSNRTPPGGPQQHSGKSGHHCNRTCDATSSVNLCSWALSVWLSAPELPLHFRRPIWRRT